MKKLQNTICGAIEMLFATLSKEEQVSLMVELYYSMYDSQKDQFLENTENA